MGGDIRVITLTAQAPSEAPSEAAPRESDCMTGRWPMCASRPSPVTCPGLVAPDLVRSRPVSFLALWKHSSIAQRVPAIVMRSSVVPTGVWHRPVRVRLWRWGLRRTSCQRWSFAAGDGQGRRGRAWPR